MEEPRLHLQVIDFLKRSHEIVCLDADLSVKNVAYQLLYNTDSVQYTYRQKTSKNAETGSTRVPTRLTLLYLC